MISQQQTLLNSLEQIIGDKVTQDLRVKLSLLNWELANEIIDDGGESGESAKSLYVSIEYLENQNAILIHCPSKQKAFTLSTKTIELATVAEQEWLKGVFIDWPGCKRPLQISSVFARHDRINNNIRSGRNNTTQHHDRRLQDPNRQDQNRTSNDESESNCLFIPSLELTFPDFLNADRPIYINSFGNRFNPPKVLYPNRAALKCQQRKPSNFVGQSVYELNYPDELDERMALILKLKNISQYEYKAFRWRGLTHKNVMEFSTDFGVVEYGGEVCWYSAPIPNCVRDTGVSILIERED